MNTNHRLLSLLGIFSLLFLGLVGCGEKRIHVATVSGSPGEELVLDPVTGDIETQSTSGLGNASLDESALTSEYPRSEVPSSEPTTSAMANQPINMAHAPSTPSKQETLSDSSFSDSLDSSLSDSLDSSLSNPTTSESGTEFPDNSGPFASLADGQDFSTQSNSSSEGLLNPISANIQDVQEPATLQDFSAELEDTFSGEDIEPIPDTFQIAKAEPSDSIQDRMNQIKNEELAATAEGLEDIFFQFDSWALTPEGKQSLQRTLGWFEQEPTSNLIIEGHADQRGTQAYNMVLAKKRAVSVQDYLAQLGIDSSRLAIISYGKDKPFCQDSTEVCHQLNRRGHLVILNR